MASSSEQALQDAVSTLERAFARLDAAADVSVHARVESVAQRESAQAEITHSWQGHAAQLETTISNLQGENDFLKEDNLRLSNQLQQLQRDYIELQQMAEHTVGRLDGAVKQLDLVLEH